ncbi:MAG: acyltransferase [Bacteroidetes bacterium]|nr:acyltransferase [Bacteroidota bacterium]
MKNLQYRPEIDGLRTLAVVPVILYHLGYTFINGGYYGVDVFFVISGYLITKILTQSIEEERFSMFDFWMRRVKRLLPALLTVVSVTLIVVPCLIFKPVVKEILDDVFPAIFSYFNIHAFCDFGNYWGGKSNNSFFLHVWSLSAEEQFYLFYPFLLFFSFKYFKNFYRIVVFITLCSFVFFIFYLKINRDFTFYMLPTRIWELSIGGLVSLISIDSINKPFLSKYLPMVGVMAVLISYFYGGAIISKYVVLPVIGAAMIVLFASPNNTVGSFLSTKFFVITGKLSYSAYLWHWPIIVFFKNIDYQTHYVNKNIINAFIFILTFFLAFLSYTFIENKTRNYKHTPKIVIAAIVVVSTITFYFFNYFSIYYNDNYNKLTDYFRYYNISPTQVIPDKNNAISYNMDMPIRPENFSEAYKNEGIITRVNNKEPELILFGDSHGVMWAYCSSKNKLRKIIDQKYRKVASEIIYNSLQMGRVI